MTAGGGTYVQVGVSDQVGGGRAVGVEGEARGGREPAGAGHSHRAQGAAQVDLGHQASAVCLLAFRFVSKSSTNTNNICT